MPFKRITDREEIAKILRAYMLKPDEQVAPFLATVALRKGVEWNGREFKGGLIVEAAKPMSASTNGDGETAFTLTNGDSRYTLPIGAASLSDIEYVEELR